MIDIGSNFSINQRSLVFDLGPVFVVVFSLFTSFCIDTSCQARPFCRENIAPLYNLGGSNPSRVNSRGMFHQMCFSDDSIEAPNDGNYFLGG